MAVIWVRRASLRAITVGKVLGESLQDLGAESGQTSTEISEVKHSGVTATAPDAVKTSELTLKVMKGAQARIFFVDVIERSNEEIVDLGFGALGFGNFFDHRAEVGSDEGIGVIESQLRAITLHRTLAQGVEISRFAGDPRNFCGEKEIDLAGKVAGASASAFSNGINQPMLEGPPANDRAGVGQFRHPEDDAGRFLPHASDHGEGQSLRQGRIVNADLKLGRSAFILGL